MRILLAASAAALLFASPAFAQANDKAGPSDKGKSLDAIHADQLIDQAKSGFTDAPVEERTVVTRHSASVSGRVLP